jgi:hypothetical protein
MAEVGMIDNPLERRAVPERSLGQVRGVTLELHREKTRLIEFGRYAARNRAARGLGRPETFDSSGSRISAGRHGKDASC